MRPLNSIRRRSRPSSPTSAGLMTSFDRQNRAVSLYPMRDAPDRPVPAGSSLDVVASATDAGFQVFCSLSVGHVRDKRADDP